MIIDRFWARAISPRRLLSRLSSLSWALLESSTTAGAAASGLPETQEWNNSTRPLVS
jgi:hypothetical protein